MIRQNLCLAQCMVFAADVDEYLKTQKATTGEGEGDKTIQFVQQLTAESVVDVLAVVQQPPAPIKSDILTVKDFELQVKRIYCVSKSGRMVRVEKERAHGRVVRDQDNYWQLCGESRSRKTCLAQLMALVQDPPQNRVIESTMVHRSLVAPCDRGTIVDSKVPMRSPLHAPKSM